MPDDAPVLLQLNGEETTRHWLPSHVYHDLQDAARATQYLVARYTNPGDPRLGPFVLGVEDVASARLIGHVGFSPLDGEVEISYAIAEGFRGRGYGGQAIVEACRWVAATFALETLVAVTSTANVASCRTLVRAGFAHAGDEVRNFQGSEQRVSVFRLGLAPRAPATGQGG